MFVFNTFIQISKIFYEAGIVFLLLSLRLFVFCLGKVGPALFSALLPTVAAYCSRGLRDAAASLKQ